MKRFLRYWLIFILLPWAHAGADSLVITYPQQMFSDGYPLALLKLAIDRSPFQGNYRLQEASVDVQQGRSLLLLRKKIEINVAWSMTSKERESGLRPIKIPIYKGLYGYRLFLVHRDQRARFHTGLSQMELAHERLAMQGHDWPDMKVLKHAGFNVEGTIMSDNMFELLEKGRVDYFPRSMLEIWREARKFRYRGLVVEPNLALSYPAYIFYFVHPDDQILGDAIETGLLAAIKDGSFDILFDTVIGDAVKKSQLSKRRVFRLDNPNVDSHGVYQWPSLAPE